MREVDDKMFRWRICTTWYTGCKCKWIFCKINGNTAIDSGKIMFGSSGPAKSIR